MTKKRSRKTDRGYSQRKVGTRELRQSFLIVCEGTKTEPNYFRSFRLNRRVVEVKIKGLGKSTTRLVEEALKYREEDDYDQVWCVFDRDDFEPQPFNEAIRLAEKEKMKVAYSNEAFEIWYLLHFHFYNSPMSRKAYQKKLSDCLGFEYTKNSDRIYEVLESRQADAIKNADRLLDSYVPVDPAYNNPSTTVYLLVRELNRFVR